LTLDERSLTVAGAGQSHQLVRRTLASEEMIRFVRVWATTVSEYRIDGDETNVGQPPVTAWMNIDYGDGVAFVDGFDGCQRHPAMVFDLVAGGAHLGNLDSADSCPGLGFGGSIFDDAMLEQPGAAMVLRRSDGLVIKLLRFDSGTMLEPSAQQWALPNTEITARFGVDTLTVGDCELPLARQDGHLSIVRNDEFGQIWRSCSLGTAAAPVQTLVQVLLQGVWPRSGADGHVLFWPERSDQAIILRSTP
jgi:hypothetical protein